MEETKKVKKEKPTKKPYKKIFVRGCLATFKDITLHAVKCKALKFTRLMSKRKRLGFFF